MLFFLNRIFLGLVCIPLALAACRQSYMTFCDTLQDFLDIKETTKLTEVVIGRENATNLTNVDLMKTLQLNKYDKLTNLVIIRTIKKLDITQFGLRCQYKGELDYVTFYGNIMRNIKAYMFPDLTLRKLSLVNNKIETIDKYTFFNFEIEIFDLSDNLLEVVETGSLPYRHNVTKVVSLKNNRLSHIEKETFAPSLRSLYLDNNRLSFIQSEALQDLQTLEELTLSHNNFNRLPGVSHMKTLVFVDVSFNKIEMVDSGTFKDMAELRFLDLSNNRINRIDILTHIFPFTEQPSLTISLSLNSLRDLITDNITLDDITLVLHGNPFGCDEQLRLRRKLAQHESECDVKFYKKENVPICINYRSEYHYFAEEWNEDVAKFQETVKGHINASECQVTPYSYQWVNSVDFGCVA